MDIRPIGMFDSGIGGLTVLKEIRKRLPNEEIIYLGDTQNFPYGSKSKSSIIEISKKCVEFLIQKNVKLIVIACGTATSQALEELKKYYKIPIIGIIEPTVDYIKNNRIKDNETIGVIATSGTIKSGEWEKSIKNKINNVNVINEKAPLLATMAEEGWTNNKVAEYTIKEYMKCFINTDRLILGCTHYPLFEDLIKKELNNTEIINTGIKVAEYVRKYLNYKNIENNEEKKGFEIYLTDTERHFKELGENLLNESLDYRINRARI